jgi:hypothetical protein
VTTVVDDDVLVKDAGDIGRAMLKTIRRLSAEQNRPAHEFIAASIQALIVLNSVVLEEDAEFQSLKKGSRR